MFRIVFVSSLALMTMILLAACSTPISRRRPTAEAWMEPPYKVGDFIDVRRHGKVTFEQLLDGVRNADVVYLGENHFSAADHDLQRRIIEASCKRQPPPAVAMEMFQQQSQPVLEQWVEGNLTEDAFVKKSHWYEQWGYPFRLYRPVLDAVKKCKLKLIGLNLPHSVVSKIAKSGFASLTPEEKKYVAADMDLSVAAHRKRMRSEYREHPGSGIKDFESFYRAQLAWEETMAEKIAEVLGKVDRGTQILVLIGNGHIVHGFGVPDRALRRRKYVYKTIVPMPVGAVNEGLEPGLADYVYVTDELPMHPIHRARLGVMVRPAEGEGSKGLVIVRIAEKSPAGRGGVRARDVLLRVDGNPVNRVSDIREALAGSHGYHTLLVRRGKEMLTIVVHIVEGKSHKDMGMPAP